MITSYKLGMLKRFLTLKGDMVAVRYVVFDWDGTLADTYPVISAAYRHTFESLGMTPISYDEIKKITSTLANKDTLGVVFGDKKELAKKSYYNYINTHHTKGLQPILHAKNLLDFCRDAGLQLLLLTSKKRPYLLEEVKYLGFAGYFSKIVAAGDFAEDKPSPKAVYALFEDSLPDSDTILVVGDGLADWKVSQVLNHSGKKSLCAIYDPKKTFSGANPDYFVSDIADIISILQEKNNE